MNRRKIAALIASLILINASEPVMVSATELITNSTEIQKTFSGEVDGIIYTVGNVSSLQKVMSLVENGDTVVLKAGEYNLNLNINKSITLMGESKENTKLNGKITASADLIESLNIKNITINADSQHIALWQNTNVKAISIDNVIFNHLLSKNQATMYYWGTQESGGYDLISITNSTFNYPNAGTGSDVVNINGEVVDRAFVGQTWDAKKVVFSNNTINQDATATIRKGFELSGSVNEFTAENNNFNKTRYSLFAWLTDESDTAIFNVNDNKFTNSTTSCFEVDDWTGNVLGTLNATGNQFDNCLAEVVINGGISVNSGSMEGYYGVYSVNSSTGLQEALSQVKAGDLIELKAGNYDMTKEVEGIKGSSFIIDKDNITIKANGDAVIYASSTAPNGSIYKGLSGQNTVLVTGENVTLDGLKIMPIQSIGNNTNQYNKAVEVGEYSNKAISTFTMRNCIVTPNTEIEGNNYAGYGGQVSINTSASTADSIVIENNTFKDSVLDPRTAITATGNTFDGASPVHKTALRFRLQPEGVLGGNTKTYTAYVNNNTFTNIAEDEKMLQVAVANTIEMTDNTLPEERTVASLLNLKTAAGQGNATVIIDGVEYLGTIHETVNNATELKNALATAKAGDTIILNEGVYDVSRGTEIVEGQAGWYLPITQSDVTLKGNGNVVLTSSEVANSGVWAAQNFITVFGDNVTIDGVTIKSHYNEYYANVDGANKAIEVKGDNFTLKNSKIESRDGGNDFAGTIYFSNPGKTATIQNTDLNKARISLSGTDSNTVLNLQDVTIDFAGTNSEAAYWAYWNTKNANVVVDNFNVIMSNAMAPELAKAINMLPENTSITLTEGIYDVERGTENIEGQSEWYLPITQNNITIKGDGDVVLTSSVESTNGSWASQNLITVFGDNVVIDGVTIKSKLQTNKAIEVLGKDFKLVNSTITKRDDATANYAGSIYFNGKVGNPVIENVNMIQSSIGFPDASTELNLTLKNTTLDFTNIEWSNWNALSAQNGTTKKVTVDNFKVIADNKLDNLQTQVINRVPVGTTVQLASGEYAKNITLNKAINLVGANTGINPNTETRNEESVITGTITLAVNTSDIKVEGFKFTGKGNINSTKGGNHNLVVENNVVQDLTDVTAFLYTSGITSNNVKVLNNNINGVTNAKNTASGIILWNINNADVTGNYIENVSFHGVQFNTSDGVVNVSNNELKDINLCAIQFADNIKGQVNITNNNIDNAAQETANWNYSAIRLYSSRDQFDANVDISNNVITNSKFGLLLSNREADGTPCKINAKVNNNKFYTVEGDYLAVSILNSSNIIDLTKNYWGSETPNFAELTKGKVNAFPYYSDEAMTNLVDKQKEDVNGDGVVNITDLSETASNYGKNSTNPHWDAKYDIAENMLIDIFDLVSIAKKMK